MVAIGSEPFVLPLGALGFEMCEADASTFGAALDEALARPEVDLVVCGESLLGNGDQAALEERIGSASAIVLFAPDGPEPRGRGLERVRAAIERAAGVDLLSTAEADAPEGEEASETDR
jgi:vacuolar-type H+-ATPase subunit F/Vma7